MTPETSTTSDHEEIRRWVEHHNGVPATVRDTQGQDATGALQFAFPGTSEELDHVSWDVWFEQFDREGLQLVYQSSHADGGASTFFTIVLAD